MTNLLLIIIIPTWSQALFTPASDLTSQPIQGWFFLHTSEVEIQRMNNLLQ